MPCLYCGAIYGHPFIPVMALNPQQKLRVEDEVKATYYLAFGGIPPAPPIDLGRIVESLGLRVYNGNFQDDTIAGMFDRANRAIYVAKNDFYPRMAFTIAHEIGHYVLHQNKDKEVFHRYNAAHLDSAVYQNPEVGIEENEANWFAASLLMPKEHVARYCHVAKDLNSLAEAFGVSSVAMDFRLRNLGLTLNK